MTTDTGDEMLAEMLDGIMHITDTGDEMLAEMLDGIMHIMVYHVIIYIYIACVMAKKRRMHPQRIFQPDVVDFEAAQTNEFQQPTVT